MSDTIPPPPDLPARAFELDPFQKETIAHLDAGRSVIVAAPTGAGKTLLAEYLIEQALEAGERAVYTAPIKALSNQKFRDFRERYGDRVGILTGDVTLNPSAPVLIMTTEIFRNQALERDGRLVDTRRLVFDEIHYLADEERGTVWEESLILAPDGIQILCLSATISNLDELAAWMGEIRGAEVATVRETGRPVPLRTQIYVKGTGKVDWKGLRRLAARDLARSRGGGRGRRGDPRTDRRRLAQARDDTVLPRVISSGHLPCLTFVFSRKRCEELAERWSRKPILKPTETKEVLALYDDLCARYGTASSGDASAMRGCIRQGVAFHHAGLLPTVKEVVERCFTSGKIRLLFATETFAMGINMPAAAVVFDTLVRYDGVGLRYLTRGEFQQMAGRAGRRGMDEVGHVYAQIDPRDVDPDAIADTVRGKPEPILSSFNLSYASILNLYIRMGDDVADFATKSFAAFQRRARRGGKHGRDLWREELAARLRLLAARDYLADGSLTPLGEHARRIHGHELPFVELLEAGVLAALDPEGLAAVAAAVIHEPRRSDPPAPPAAGLAAEHQREASRTIRKLRTAERGCGVRIRSKRLHFHLSKAAAAWAGGVDFDTLLELAGTDPGDIVRVLRQTVQLLRQASDVVMPRDPDLGRRLAETVARINRDEVDAERQLRTG